PHAISALLARDLAEHKVKIITTLHGTDITVLGYDKIFQRMISYGIEQSDVVTAVSHALAQQTKEQLKVEKAIHVIYNFINEQVYYRKNRDDLKTYYQIA